MTQAIETSEALTRYLRLLIRLHEMMVRGTDEAEEGDGLREQMDGPWRMMSTSQIALARAFASDLGTIRPRPAEGTRPASPDFAPALQAAHRRKDFAAALALLRSEGGALPPGPAAYFRGRCWAELAGPEASVPFYRAAAELDRSNPNYEFLYVDALVSAGDIDAALRWVSDVLTRNSPPGRLLIKAADVLFLSTREPGKANETTTLQRVIDTINLALNGSSAVDAFGNIPESLIVHALAQKGTAQEVLGRYADALDAYTVALSLNPDNDAALTARGLLRLDSSAAEAKVDLRRATDLRSPLVWPYFYLAHLSIRESRFDDTLRFCSLALERTDDGTLTSSLHEWTAIALIQSRGVPAAGQARQHLQAALALAPWRTELVEGISKLERWLKAGDPQNPPTLSIAEPPEPQVVRPYRMRERQERERVERLFLAA